MPREPACSDETDATTCAGWAKSGECEKNPGFMRSSCQKSCGTCPPALWEGKQATARVRHAGRRTGHRAFATAFVLVLNPHAFSHQVRNAWEENEDMGRFIAFFTATHVEAHEARVIRVSFGDAADSEHDGETMGRPSELVSRPQTHTPIATLTLICIQFPPLLVLALALHSTFTQGRPRVDATPSDLMPWRWRTDWPPLRGRSPRACTQAGMAP